MSSMNIVDHYSAEIILQHTDYFDLGDSIKYLNINMKMQNSRKPWCWTNFDNCQNDSGNSLSWQSLDHLCLRACQALPGHVTAAGNYNQNINHRSHTGQGLITIIRNKKCFQ